MRYLILVSVFLALVVSTVFATASDSRITSDEKIAFPDDYRSWTFLTSGLGMSYSPGSQALAMGPMFDNVFVTPDAYRAFVATGHWPDKTEFVKEIRGSHAHGSISKQGRFEADVMEIDVEVRDDSRFPGQAWKWAGFAAPVAGVKVAAVAPFPRAACEQCHASAGAVDKSFVQFYPTLLPIARAKRTLNASYRDSETINPIR